MSNSVYDTVDNGLKTQSLGTDKCGLAPHVLDITPVLRPPLVGLEFSVNGMSNEETILLQPDDDDIIRHKISDGCYWALVISIISVIIVSTLWCIIKYYHTA